MFTLKKIIFAFSLLLCSSSRSQIIAKNTLFIEGLGNSATISFNYDRVIYQSKIVKLNINGGVGVLPYGKNKAPNGTFDYGIPLSVDFNIGKKNHYFEIGAGLTYNRGLYSVFNSRSINYSEAFFFVPRIGYRYQRNKAGFFFRVGFTPLILVKDYSRLDLVFNFSSYAIPIFTPMGGISLGYSFH